MNSCMRRQVHLKIDSSESNFISLGNCWNMSRNIEENIQKC